MWGGVGEGGVDFGEVVGGEDGVELGFGFGVVGGERWIVVEGWGGDGGG